MAKGGDRDTVGRGLRNQGLLHAPCAPLFPASPRRAGEETALLETSPCPMPRSPCYLIATSSWCLLEAFCLIQLVPPVIRLVHVRNPKSDQKHHVSGTGWRGPCTEGVQLWVPSAPPPRPLAVWAGTWAESYIATVLTQFSRKPMLPSLPLAP